MINLKVDIDKRTYPIYIGIDILPKVPEIYKLYGFKPRLAIIADENSRNLSSIISEKFQQEKIQSISINLSDQQLETGFDTTYFITRKLIENGFKSGDSIVLLGGSRLGNICSFIGEIIYGGVPIIQIPTTLTSQVTQSVNPKTRLNFGGVQNLFEINSHRNLVWIDIGILKSLPERNFISGLGHIIQYSFQLKTGLFEFLINYIERILAFDLELIEETIMRSCEARMKIIQNNEFSRNSIGFGDFVASTILEMSSPPSIKYGEALIFGMLVEGIISFKSGIFVDTYFERFYELLKRIPWKHLKSELRTDALIACFENKLRTTKHTQFYLPQKIGEFSAYKELKMEDFKYALNLLLSD